MVGIAVAIIFFHALATPDSIAFAGSPVGVSDARQVEAGTITVVHTALMVTDVVNDIAVTVRQRCRALTSGRDRQQQTADRCDEER
jgi:hypothetical protein